MSLIVNASPQIVQLGTNDKSLKPTPPRPITIPTHLPMIMGFAAGGPDTKELVDGARLLGLYGKETFDRKLPYFSHTTRLAELMSAAGNAIMYWRIIPDDNDTIANVTIYIDVLKDTVDVYTRNLDGSIAVDGNGDNIVSEQHEGYRLKVIAEVNQDDVDVSMGTKKSKTGYMTDSDGNKSTMYPVVEFRASYKGLKYNNIGFSFNLPTADKLNTPFLEGNLALPYEFYMFKRADANSTGVTIKNLFGSETQQFVFKDGAKDPVTNRPITLKDTTDTWYNLDNPLKDLVYPNIATPYVYQNNMDMITQAILVDEKDYINADVTTLDGTVVNTSSWLDFVNTAPVDDQYRIVNFFTAMSTKRVPAFTYSLDDSAVTLADGQQEVYMSKSTPVYLGAGKDGTLNEETLEAGVNKIMDKFLDKNSRVMDPAINLENVLYDSGFRLPIKKALINFIAIRKDTFVGLSTREDNLGDKYIDLVTERAMGLNLKAALSLAPESTFFGTPVSRGIIVTGSGNDNLDPENRRYGLLMDIAYKAARMMGGTKWKKELMFDRGDKNIILNYSNIQPEFIPSSIKPDLWNVGLIWPQPYDLRAYSFPAMQSVYDNDTSVLNNIFMAIALTTTEKVAAAAFRKFTGDISSTPSEFIDEVETWMNNELEGKFAYIIETAVKAMITDFDEQTGYSWTVASKLYGNVMKTVMTHYIEAWNKEDM